MRIFRFSPSSFLVLCLLVSTVLQAAPPRGSLPAAHRPLVCATPLLDTVAGHGNRPQQVPAPPKRKRIQIINGVNVNLLGKTPGTKPFEPFLEELRRQYPDVQIDYYQSNSEGDLVNKLQAVGFDYDGIILNPGAFVSYSYAIAYIVSTATTPVVEVHLLNLASLDPERRNSVTAKGARGMVAGLGLAGYRFALESLLHPE